MELGGLFQKLANNTGGLDLEEFLGVLGVYRGAGAEFCAIGTKR